MPQQFAFGACVASTQVQGPDTSALNVEVLWRLSCGFLVLLLVVGMLVLLVVGMHVLCQIVVVRAGELVPAVLHSFSMTLYETSV